MKQILFPDDAEFWYETQRSFDQIAYGGGDFGEVLVISEQITEGDYGSWYDAYLAAADRIAAEADDALRAGHRVGARDGLLRASSYYRSADFFLQGHPPTNRRIPTRMTAASNASGRRRPCSPWWCSRWRSRTRTPRCRATSTPRDTPPSRARS
jgi:hypothetical protein